MFLESSTLREIKKSSKRGTALLIKPQNDTTGIALLSKVIQLDSKKRLMQEKTEKVKLVFVYFCV